MTERMYYNCGIFIFLRFILVTSETKISTEENYKSYGCVKYINSKIIEVNGSVLYLFTNKTYDDYIINENYKDYELLPRMIFNTDKPIQHIDVGTISRTDFFIALVDNLQSLKTSSTRIYTHVKGNWQLPNKKVIVFMRQPQDIEKIIKFFWKYKTIHFGLITLGANTTKYYKAEYFSKGYRCGRNPKPIHLGDCFKYEIKNHVNFESFQCNGCKLRTLVLHQDVAHPYIKNLNSSDPGPFINLLNLAAEKMNFKMIHKMASKEASYNYLANAIDGEITEAIRNGSADVMVFTYNRQIYSYFTSIQPSSMVYMCTVNWYTQKHLMTVTETFFNIIEIKCLITIIAIACIISIINWCITRYFTTSNNPRSCHKLLNSYGILLEIVLLPKIKSKILYLTFGTYIIFSLHISSLYKGKLISAFTKPIYKKGVTDIKGLVESDLIPMAWNRTKLSIGEIQDPLAKQLYDKTQVQNLMMENERLDYLIAHKNSAVILCRHSIHLFPELRAAIDVIGPPNFLLKMESSYGFQLRSPFLKKLDKFIRETKQNGIRERIFTLDHKHKNMKGFDPVPSPVPLSLKHLKGPFIVYLSGVTLALVIFLCEKQTIFKHILKKW